MILGLDLTTFTLLHVLISLIGVVTGFVVMAELLRSRSSGGWTTIFLATTIVTSASGFLFPFSKLLPSHIVGIISLALLAVAVFAFYGRHMHGVWRPVYIVTALLSLYLNVFVMIIQAFMKISILKGLAPTQTESPFLIVQGMTFLCFLAVIVVAAIKYRPSLNARLI
jgi:hypothetical protein